MAEASALLVLSGLSGVGYAFYQSTKISKLNGKLKLPAGDAAAMKGEDEESAPLRGEQKDTETRHVTSTTGAGSGSGAGASASAPVSSASQMAQLDFIASQIRAGSIKFLWQEYTYMGVFMVFFAALVTALVGSGKDAGFGTGIATAAAFVAGGLTSIVSGFIGMRIAVEANWRTTLAATKNLEDPFQIAFRAGSVMGFGLTGLGLLVMYALIGALNIWFPYTENAEKLFEVVAGYGLGGSAIALFGRVGGGIYTKAADVGSDLAGKLDAGLKEDDPRNPGVIADNVGDNVGDIAGNGSDLFGSFAEASSAALVVAASSADIRSSWAALMFPLSISAAGIVVCIFTTLAATECTRVNLESKIEPTLRWQLIGSTIAMTPVSFLLARASLPATFCVKALDASGSCPTSTPFQAFLCVLVGLWVGLFIGLITERYTSHAFTKGPVREVANAALSSAASTIIWGLALGYESAVMPVTLLSGTVFLAHNMCGMFGVALAALGMLSTLAVGLTIDAYGPVADNAGGIAEMAQFDESVRERTDALDAAGNTTAAIGKGFAIGSAALVSLALFGAFVTRTNMQDKGVDLLQPITFAGLLFGAMLPYWFSAMTMKSVGMAADEMVAEIRRQWEAAPGGIEGVKANPAWVPDYERCIEISTKASLKEMMKPGALTLLSPIVVGFLFGVHAVTGLLAGAMVSGTQMAISASNSGGAWDNAKKYINSSPVPALQKSTMRWVLEDSRDAGRRGGAEFLGRSVPHPDFPDDDAARIPVMKWSKVNTAAYENAVTGDTVGDPMKDTSGPSLNILMKLMSIVSLVFADFFVAHSLKLGVTEVSN